MAIARIFDPDAQAIHIGTAADEFYIGGAAYVQVMERTHTQTIPDLQIEFAPGFPAIQTRSAWAWATGQALVSGTAPNGRYFAFPTRLTFVLEKAADRWQIVHSHYSIGVPTP